MDVVIDEFHSRVKDINLYFEFIAEFENDKTRLYKSHANPQKINKDLYKILKANLFLLLYNAVESSFTDALEKLCAKLSDSETLYKDVTDKLQELYLKKKYNSFDGNKAVPKGEKKLPWLVNTIKSLSREIIEIQFDKKDISGNLNAEKITAFALDYGFMTEKIDNLKNSKGQSTYIVKHNRNSLAHGNISFAECGGNFSIAELDKIKNETVEYMKDLLEIIKSHIDGKKYLR